MNVSGKRVAIVQSNYIPWKGYFYVIHSVDEFILFDTAQYTRRDWRDRNRIKTRAGLQWLTIPVGTKGGFPDRIGQIGVTDSTWNQRHWRTIEATYPCSPHSKSTGLALEALSLGSTDLRL